MNVRGSEVISLAKQGDTITAYLVSTLPLAQYIKGGAALPSPDWSVADNQPVITPVVKSSLQNTRLSTKTEKWYYNDVEITFDAGGSSTNFNGTFIKGRHTDGVLSVSSLKIVKNLAAPANLTNDTIRFEGVSASGGFDSPVQCNIEIRIEEIVGDPYQSWIQVNDGGVIDTNTPELILTAKLMRGASEVSSATYLWERLNNGAWDKLNIAGGNSANLTTQSITVREGDIDSSAIYRCTYSVASEEVSKAVAKVSDETDPLIILLGRNTTSAEVSLQQPTITYSPSLVKRGSQTPIPATFAFSLINSKGTVIKQGTPGSNTFNVTYSDLIAVGEDVTIEIVGIKS